MDNANSRPADMGGCYRILHGVICLAPETVKFRVSGRIHYCEPAHGYYGPVRMKNDDTWHARQWGEKHPFWEVYGEWERRGRMVDGDGFGMVPS